MDLREELQPRRCLQFQQDDDVDVNEVSHTANDDVASPTNVSSKIMPELGMEFESEEAAYQFYNAYVLQAGFSIRKSKFHNVNGELVDRIFVCSREGFREEGNRAVTYQIHQTESRCGCLAKLKINSRQTGKLKIVDFIVEHNHNLASPSKTHLFRSHRKMTSAQVEQINMIEGSGIPPKAGFDLMATQSGGRESLGFTHIDYKNHLRTKRTLEMKTGDTSGVLEYLQKKQLEDPSFFYAIQVDEDDLVTNIFWADAKMMTDYEDFGDVVCFDTTYRKHKDGRPIALFVGVNHHKQTIIFGAALLYDKTTATFMWLFDTFSEAMGGKSPKTILTDQDAAMASALKSQWSQTYHRLCVWHIFQNAAIHLSHVFAKFKDFTKEFSSCVYDYDQEDEFLHAWNDMLTRYDLQDNDWLKRMFNIKEKWALVYGRDTFCADMTTTQRSESMNKVIKHYVSYKHDLRRFFLHFERLLNDRRYDERVADFKADQTNVALPFPVQILKHAASVYTPTVFKLFQVELSKSYDCIIAENNGIGMLVTYIVCPYQKHYRHSVTYDTQEETISCSCRKFEFGGMLCSHVLKVFSTRGITQIPSKYILKRWTKGKRNGSIGSFMTDSQDLADVDPKVAVGRRYRNLCRLTTRLSARAAENEEDYEEVKNTVIMLLEKVGLNKTLVDSEGTRVKDHHVVLDSTGVMKTVKGIKAKPKSGNSSKRPKGALESAKKPRRTKKKSSAQVLEQDISSPQVNQMPCQESQAISSNILPAQPQVNQIHSYQDLLTMDYNAAESLMYEFLEPTQQNHQSL